MYRNMPNTSTTRVYMLYYKIYTHHVPTIHANTLAHKYIYLFIYTNVRIP